MNGKLAGLKVPLDVLSVLCIAEAVAVGRAAVLAEADKRSSHPTQEVAMEQKPSVGRIVHYTNLGDAAGKYPPETQAAIITGVYGDGPVQPAGAPPVVDLHIFYRTGQFDMMAVPFSETPKRGHWNWPPRM